jgi:hypothetical protein
MFTFAISTKTVCGAFVSLTCLLCCLGFGSGLCILCVFCPNTLSGADIALDIEGHISVVAAAIPYTISAWIFPCRVIARFHTGRADAWKAMFGSSVLVLNR